jgi:hypothetical protein
MGYMNIHPPPGLEHPHGRLRAEGVHRDHRPPARASRI